MTFTYFPNLPNPPDDPADDVAGVQTNSASIASLVAVDHVGFNKAGGGQHAQVTFNANNVPTPPVSPPVLFTNTVNGLPELFFYSGDSAHSSTQYAASGNGSALLLGGLIVKWGSGTLSAPYSSTGTSISFTSAFPNNCFAVLAQTQDGGSGTTANTFAYARTFSASAFNLLITFRTSTGQPGSGSVNYTYIAIGN